jgi:hypothetical protein
MKGQKRQKRHQHKRGWGQQDGNLSTGITPEEVDGPDLTGRRRAWQLAASLQPGKLMVPDLAGSDRDQTQGVARATL